MNKLEGALQEVSREFPERLAVQFRDRRISYGRLAAVLDSLSEEFGDLSGRRVVSLLPDGVPAYLWHLHLYLGGGINIPISVQATTAKIRALCERVQPHFIVTNGALRQRHRAVLGSYPCVVVQSDSADVPWGFDYETLGGNGCSFSRTPVSEGGPNKIRMIVFTSGSTGEPKGVCLSERNLLAAAEMMASFLGLDPSRKSLATVPLYDYYGFIQIYGHLLGRCGYILGESILFPDRILKKIREERVTDLVLVPYTLRELLRMITVNKSDALQHLKFMTSSSDLLTPDLLTHVFSLNPDLRVFNIYGLTEAGRACYKELRGHDALAQLCIPMTVRYASAILFRISMSISRAMPASSAEAITSCSSTSSPRRKPPMASSARPWELETSPTNRFRVSAKEGPSTGSRSAAVAAAPGIIRAAPAAPPILPMPPMGSAMVTPSGRCGRRGSSLRRGAKSYGARR